MRDPSRSFFLLALVAIAPHVAATPVDVDDASIQQGLGWLLARTRPDGCVAAEPTGACSHATTRDAVIALSAAGAEPAAWSQPSPVDYLAAAQGELAAEPGACTACKHAKTILALAAAGQDPRRFGGHDAVADLDAQFDGVQVGSPAQINDDAWALMAYAALDDPPRAKMDAIRLHLGTRQNPGDGAWGWNLGASEPWGTATVALALLSSGTAPGDAGLARAFVFLRSNQGPDGLIVQDAAPSAESTAIAVQSVRAYGEDPRGAAWTKGASLVDALMALQATDGSFAHNRGGGSRFLATTQVLPALREVPYPFRPPSIQMVLGGAAVEGMPVRVDAHATDPDGAPPKVRWWIDGQPLASGASVAWTPERAGAHAVRARAEDEDGVARTVEAIVDVTPAAAASGTPSQEPITLEATAVPVRPVPAAPQGDVAGPSLVYLIMTGLVAARRMRRR